MACAKLSKTINFLKYTISTRLFMDGANWKLCFESAQYQSEMTQEEEDWCWEWARGHKDNWYADCRLEFLVQGGCRLWDSNLRFWGFCIPRWMGEYASQAARLVRNSPWGQFACTMCYFVELSCDYKQCKWIRWSQFAATTSDPWFWWDPESIANAQLPKSRKGRGPHLFAVGKVVQVHCWGDFVADKRDPRQHPLVCLSPGQGSLCLRRQIHNWKEVNTRCTVVDKYWIVWSS